VAYGIIYCAYNTISHKYYIGQTTRSLAERWKEHCWTPSSKQTYFAKAIRKYGKSAFELTILATAGTHDQLNDLERLWIITTRSFDPKVGYNSTFGGDRSEPTEEIRAKLRGTTCQRRLASYAAYEAVRLARLVPEPLSTHPWSVRGREIRRRDTSARLSRMA
jgi:group I intron endonuclease